MRQPIYTSWLTSERTGIVDKPAEATVFSVWHGNGCLELSMILEECTINFTVTPHFTPGMGPSERR